MTKIFLVREYTEDRHWFEPGVSARVGKA